MDKITTYRKILLQFLNEYKTYWSGSNDPLKYRIIVDSEQNTYQMLRIGWDGDDYYHDCIYHFDIINGKVWIQKNETDRLIAQELVSMGIPKHDIVLGLLPPIMRKDSEYAAA